MKWTRIFWRLRMRMTGSALPGSIPNREASPLRTRPLNCQSRVAQVRAATLFDPARPSVRARDPAENPDWPSVARCAYARCPRAALVAQPPSTHYLLLGGEGPCASRRPTWRLLSRAEQCDHFHSRRLHARITPISRARLMSAAAIFVSPPVRRCVRYVPIQKSCGRWLVAIGSAHDLIRSKSCHAVLQNGRLPSCDTKEPVSEITHLQLPAPMAPLRPSVLLQIIEWGHCVEGNTSQPWKGTIMKRSSRIAVGIAASVSLGLAAAAFPIRARTAPVRGYTQRLACIKA